MRKERLISVPLCSTMYYIMEGDDIMAFSIRLTPEERNLAESYARLHSVTLSEAFKKALFEKIEDEYDVAIANEAYEDYLKDNKKSKPIEKLWEELNI